MPPMIRNSTHVEAFIGEVMFPRRRHVVGPLNRCIAESNGDIVALRALIEKEARLERRRLKKNLFIQAVSDATDFKQVRCSIFLRRTSYELSSTSFSGNGGMVSFPLQSRFSHRYLDNDPSEAQSKYCGADVRGWHNYNLTIEIGVLSLWSAVANLKHLRTT